MNIDAYRDLGNGLYFTLDIDWGVTGDGSDFGYIADTLSDDPNVIYGPAAWNRGVGPDSGEVLLYVGAVDQPVESAFPGAVMVTEAGRAAGLGHLDGVVFEDMESLLAAAVTDRPPAALKVSTHAERLGRL